MAKREKVIPCIITSRESLQSVVADIVQLKLEHKEITARMEQEIALIQKRYQEQLVPKAKQIEIKEQGVYLYCRQNRRELFPTEKKSIDLLVATVGFRTHPHAVERLRSKETWGQIAARLESLPWGEDFIRYPDPAVDKEALIAARGNLTQEQLETIGVRIEQEESFYIEAHSQVLEPSVKEAA